MNRSISRRDALAKIALAAAAAGVGITRRARAQDTRTAKSIPNSGTYQVAVGNFQVTILSDGYGAFPADQPMWAPEATAHDLKQALADAFLPTDQLTLSFNPILIDTGKDVLLCDTGSGKLLLPSTGRLLQQIRTAGYEPDRITSVFLSHAHVDHLGGLLTEDGQPVFSSAQHFVHKPEWDFWTGKNPDLSKQRLDDKTKSNFIQLAQKTFGTLEQNFKRVPAGTNLVDGVAVEAAPGHTPGHSLLRIQSDKQELVHFFDLAHHSVIMFKNPAWTGSGARSRHQKETVRRIRNQAKSGARLSLAVSRYRARCQRRCRISLGAGGLATDVSRCDRAEYPGEFGRNRA